MPTEPPALEYADAVQIALRGGYSGYYSLHFVTAGGEVGVRTLAELRAVLGVETYLVRRLNPPDVALATGELYRWESFLPVNLGAVYALRFDDGRIRPYAGGDMIVASYLQDPKNHFTVGARLRAGVDAMLVEHVGLELNGAIGAWGGNRWSEISAGIGNNGLIGEISGGAVFAF